MTYKPFLLLISALSSSIINASPIVDIKTNKGTITIELFEQANTFNGDKEIVSTTNNFLKYVDAGFYDNTLFHRIIKDFVIQGGGLDAVTSTIKPTLFPPITLQDQNQFKNDKDTIAMARLNTPDSATAQFFINTADNAFLNYKAPEADKPGTRGYAVFGKVIQEQSTTTIETLNTIVTNTQDSPTEKIIIESIRLRIETQLAFQGSKPSYSTGEAINLTLTEQNIKRQTPVDLWVAIRLPNGEFIYLDQATGSFTSNPSAFKQNIQLNENSFPVLNFTVPANIAGRYTLFAIYNKLDSDISNLESSLRSNIAEVLIDIVN